MKFSTAIVSVLTACSAVEAHNVRTGHSEQPQKRIRNTTSREYLAQKREHLAKRTRAQPDHKPREYPQQHKPREHPQHKPREDDVPSLIIGGTQSNQNEFPYYVDTASCGGSLIAPKVVLTAAHCGNSYYDGQQVIINGYKRGDVGQNGIFRTVSEVIMHPGYSRTTLENDIELYLLTEAVTGLSVTLELNSDPSYPSDGTDVTALGIGMQNQAGGGIDRGTFLYDVVIPVVNIASCDAAWGDFLNPDVMICAGTSGKGVCMGDSGGPLVVRNGNTHTQVGVVSFGVNNQCAKGNAYENVFARTSGAFNWIKGIVCDQWGEEAAFCPPGCTNLSGWSDSAGDGCDWYEEYESAGFPVCEDYQDDFDGTNGKNPVEACCVCKYVV